MKEKLPDLRQRGGADTYARHDARPPSQTYENVDGQLLEVKPCYNDGINLHANDGTPQEHRGVAAVHSTHDKRRDMPHVQQKRPSTGPRSGGSSVGSLIGKGMRRLNKSYQTEDTGASRDLTARAVAQDQSWEHEIHRLRAVINSQHEEIGVMSSRLQAEELNNKKLRESMNKMILAMESKDLFVGRQSTDDTVSSRFGQLLGQVKTWSVPFAENDRALPLADLPDTTKTMLRRILPNTPSSDLSRRSRPSPKVIRLLVRGLVSLGITEMLFRTLPTPSQPEPPANDAWVDKELAQAIHLVEMRFFGADPKAISLREFHDWRALSTNLASKQGVSNKSDKSSEAHIRNCMAQIFAAVVPFAPERRRAQLEHDLFGILHQAVELSQMLRCQRACWSVRHVVPPPSSSFDIPLLLNEFTMEDIDGDMAGGDDLASTAKKTVSIVVSPALFKRGNTDGEQFDVETCVVKAEVNARPPARQASSGRH
ncbi:MAG: hypothetical protein Q9225_007930 [Loekoesia sp. 1 TL-2023]